MKRWHNFPIKTQKHFYKQFIKRKGKCGGIQLRCDQCPFNNKDCDPENAIKWAQEALYNMEFDKQLEKELTE